MCGIIGYLGKNKVDTAKAKLLMLLNKDRGTDSTGFAYNKLIFKTTDSVDKFLTTYEINVPGPGVFLGHVRKKSAGKLISAQAHPIAVYPGNRLVYDKKEKESPELVLVQNGTISNISELSRKYGTGYIYGDSDTEHVALILNKLGKENYKEFFDEYEGSCTAVFYWTDDPKTVYIVKDSERPLFVYSDDLGDVWISSIESSLVTVQSTTNKDKFSLLKFKDNCIHVYRNHELSESIPFNKKVVSYYQEWDNYNHGGGYHRNQNNNHNNFSSNKNTTTNSSRTMSLSFLPKSIVDRINHSKNNLGIDIIFDKENTRFLTRFGDELISLHGTISDKDNTYYFLSGINILDKDFYEEKSKDWPKNHPDAVFKIKNDALEFSKYSSHPIKGHVNYFYKGKCATESTKELFNLNFLGFECALEGNKLLVVPLDLNYFRSEFMVIDKAILGTTFSLLYEDNGKRYGSIETLVQDVKMNLGYEIDNVSIIKSVLYLFSDICTNFDFLNFLWQSSVDCKFMLNEHPSLLEIFDEILYLIHPDVTGVMTTTTTDIYSQFYLLPNREDFLKVLESKLDKETSSSLVCCILLANVEHLSCEELIEAFHTTSDVRLNTITNKKLVNNG